MQNSLLRIESMAGRISAMIDKICIERSKGNAVIYSTTKTKLLLKGVDPSQFDAYSADDPEVIVRLKAIAKDMGVVL